jgi:putative SOS response-associated peptidase YedK
VPPCLRGFLVILKTPMCYHVSIPEKQQIEEFLGLGVNVDEWMFFYHHLSAFSFAKIPVMTQEDQQRIHAYRWGLIPKWVKDEAAAKEMMLYTLNAKSETIFEKPSFRSSVASKRCLIFVNGFFEWRDFRKKKYPYFITLKNQSVFAMGGIYESWVNEETGEIIDSCSIVTTPANELMSEIHNVKLRMPLIFSKEKMMDWINPEIEKEKITELMKPFRDEEMEARTISKLITSRKKDSNVEEVKKEFQYAELNELF